MISLLSPAKTLDFETAAPTSVHSELLFADQAAYLAGKLARMSPAKLRQMMDISEDLAQRNAKRYSDWALPIDEEVGRPAIFAFQGDVYQGLSARDFSKGDLDYAQQHLRILSGLYGVLRPLDLILPYRLEMGTTWQITPKNKNLYAFWKETVTDHLRADLDAAGADTVLNLASQEYAKVVDFKKLGARVVAPAFKEERNGRFQMISFFAKKARGLMAAWAVRNRIDRVDALRDFDAEGYALNERLSNTTNNEWVFTRKS